MASEDLSETEVNECSETESDEECEETQQQTNSVQSVDKPGFRAMIQALNPRYQLLHKDYFNRIAIPSMYENT